ncbi:mrps-30, partial [Pristionchus pacificus]
RPYLSPADFMNFPMHRGIRPAARLIPSVRFSSTAVTETGVAVSVVEPPPPPTTTLHDAAKIKPAFNRKVHRIHTSKHMLQDEFLNAGDLTDSARLYDYKRTGEIAASLTNIVERIAFVSPYERPWTAAERTWRRDWHPALVAPRKAWALPAVPAHFDVLNFYKYITKTHVEQGKLDELYKDLHLPTRTFKELTRASLRANLESTAFDSEADRTSALLATLLDDAVLSLVKARPQLAEQRISYKSKSEAFWVRGGFSFLYDHQEFNEVEVTQKIWNNQKYTGDDRRKLGELAFVHRDELAASVRSVKGLEPMMRESESTDVFWKLDEGKLKDELYSPRVFNLWPDADPLWQCPGYFTDSAESHQHTVLAVKSLAGLPERITEHWRMRGEEAKETALECATAQAVATAFANLTATAHTQGFTQYNDVDAPLTTQLVLSDGRNFYFAVAQLNTLAINVELKDFPNPRHNSLRIEGPFPLYDEVNDGRFVYERKEGLNEAVLERLLHMVYKIK